jgi:hypothetical protein
MIAPTFLSATLMCSTLINFASRQLDILVKF